MVRASTIPKRFNYPETIYLFEISIKNNRKS